MLHVYSDKPIFMTTGIHDPSDFVHTNPVGRVEEIMEEKSMGTAVARIIFLLIILWVGFRNLMPEKPSDRKISELMWLFMAVGMSLAAVIHPDIPLFLFLIPIAVLILCFRCSLLFNKWRRPSENRISQSVPASLSDAGAKLVHEPFRQPWPQMGLPLIEDGKCRLDNLFKIGRTQLWLKQELRKYGYRDIRLVKYLTIDQTGNFFMDLTRDPHEV
jgi:uncharacterized membrane protein YcaP (DUF421 family)